MRVSLVLNADIFKLLFYIFIICRIFSIQNIGIYAIIGIPITKSTQGTIWPKPVTYVKNNSYLVLRHLQFNFKVERYDCDILQEAIRRYYQIIFINANTNQDYVNENILSEKERFPRRKEFVGFLDVLHVHLMSPCETYPSEYMDEHYELIIHADGFESNGLLIAQSIWGILRGLETFSQVIFPFNGSKFVVHTLSIMDFPRFPYRGLLIDTSRHYLPVKTIMRIIDAMAYSKLNVLHWHIVDDQSFPFQSTSFPLLSLKGAYDPYFAIYTHIDIVRIVEHARLRGIRVIPEFDTPGHTLSWGHALPGFLTKCETEGEYGPIDPSNITNYLIIERLFNEVDDLFPDYYLHLGGDEVDFKCWETNENITKFMKKHNINSYQELEGFYIYQILNITQKLKIKTLVWQEVFDNDVPLTDNTIVHIWKVSDYKEEIEKVTSKGKKVVFSSCWYLDHVNSGGDWLKYYQDCHPLNFSGSSAQKRLVLGGESCMWGEVVDETNIQQRIWPRACAAAEILWYGNSSPDGEERLKEHVCRLKKRGIPAQPANGPGFCPYFLI